MGRFFSRPRAYWSTRPADRVEIVHHAAVYAPLAGVQMAFFSDVHADRRFSDEALEAFFARVAALGPDIALIGGDLAEDWDSLLRLLRAMRVLKPHLGIYACLGNNDREIADFEAEVSAHMHLLVNEGALVEFGAGALAIGGVDSRKHGHPSARYLFSDRDPAFRVLLSHYPVAQDYGDGPRADLQLSGHTHGGQFNVLGLTPYATPFEWRAHRWISGECEIDGVRTIVSNGIGMSRVPLRVGVPPQVHLVQFYKSEKMGSSPVDSARRR